MGIAGCLWFLHRQRKYDRYIRALEEAYAYVGHGLIFFDKTGAFVDANDSARSFLPALFAERDSGAKTLKEFIDYFFDHAADVDEGLLGVLGRSKETDEPRGFREVILTIDGRLCLVETQKLPDGGTNVILVDVDDIKMQEDQMMRLNQFSHELYQAIQVADSGIIITKPEGDNKHIGVFANNAFLDIVGLEAEQILGRDMDGIFSRIDDDEAIRKISSVAASEERGNIELSLRHADGAPRWYDLKMTPVKDGMGRLEFFICILSDISELKMREAEFFKAQKLEALGQLSAGVAHDFNNVLSIIDGYARLSAKGRDDPQILANMERIQTASRRGANLIKQMLTFARHEIVDHTVVDLSRVVSEQETLLKPLLDASVRFKLLADKQQMKVECSSDSLTQILMNLVVNARDAMPSGGTLLVETRVCPKDMVPDVLKAGRQVQDYAMLLVSDTGMGIEPEVVSRIFDPFFTTKEQGKGTGLGLSMVYGLVKQIGGHIEVKSTLGQGTSFIVYLPLTDKPPSKAAGSGIEDDVDSIRFDGFTAIVAEDEPDLLSLVTGMLGELGMKVLPAKNGHEALAVQDEYEGRIDLLLSDVVMPELNGVELAGLLTDICPDIKVVFMSGYPAREHSAPVQVPKDSVFIPKPIKRDNLVQVVHNRLQAVSGDVELPQWASKGGKTQGKEMV